MGKTTDTNKSKGRQLTSVNLPVETLVYLDEMADRNDISRSKLVELIINDFKENYRTLSIVIT